MQNFKDLLVWQKATRISDLVQVLTANFPTDERFTIVQQMRRSAGSIEDNIAEGAGRVFPRDFARFLRISLGSAMELESQVLRACRFGYLREAKDLRELVIGVQKMLAAFERDLRRQAASR